MSSKKLKREVFINVSFAVAKILGLLLMVRLANDALPSLIGVFLLSRRVSTTATNLLQLGTSQTVVRYVSMYSEDREKKAAYLTGAVCISALAILVSVPLGFVMREPLAALMYPDQTGKEWVAFWSVAVAAATVLGFLAHSTYLAERRVVIANIVELLNVNGFALLMLGAYRLSTLTEETMIVWLLAVNAIGVFCLSLAMLSYYLYSNVDRHTIFETKWLDVFREILSYGLPRGVTAGLDMLLLLIAPWLLRYNSETAGNFVIALMLMRAIQAAIQPVARMAAVVAAKFVLKDDRESIRRGARMIIGTSMYSTLTGLAFVFPWLKTLLELWLGDPLRAESVYSFASILIWSIPALAVFRGLKPMIEVRWFRPYNLYALMGSFAVQLCLAYGLGLLMPYPQAVCLAMSFALCFLGGAALFAFRDALSPWGHWGIGRLTITVGLLMAINFGFAAAGQVILIIPAIAISIAVVVAAFRRRDSNPFLNDLLTFVRPSRPAAAT
ncbi:hypothetical protein [Rosistilla oblonga]|uniref:hypothetical protein n=1 Tax=Rosistilla oblonga TaxID=2527990 RepID=UPI003A98214B